MPGGAMGGGGGLAPFDKHPADPGALDGSAASLAAQASQTVDVADQTLGAYAPAIENWQGVAAPELAAAPKPLATAAADMNLSLTWASVAVRYWAKQVAEFNTKVDAIVAVLSATLNQPGRATMDPGAEQATRAAAIAAAQRQWHEAHETHIIQGGATTAAMLRDGPTDQHLATARAVGLVAPASDAGLPGWVTAPFGPTGQLSILAEGLKIPAALLFAGSFFRYVRADQHLGLAINHTNAWYQLRGRGWVVTPIRAAGHYAAASYHGWRADRLFGSSPAMWRAGETTVKAGKALGHAGSVFSGGVAAADQWLRDSGREDLSDAERVGRAAGRGLGVGAAAAAGAAVGSIVPGVGTVAGAIIGAGLSIGASWFVDSEFGDDLAEAGGEVARELTE